MDAVLIAQGTELTTGAVLDTNSRWLCDRLWRLGVSVRRILVAPDRKADLVEIFQQAAALAPVVVCTGGLGPTRDDLTAEAVGEAFGQPIVRHADALAQITARYAAWGREMADANRKQADLPASARVLQNHWGTAPAFSVEHGATTLYFLPGVPREMKALFDHHIQPDLLDRYALVPPVVRVIRVMGVAESELEMRLRPLVLDGLEIGFQAGIPDNLVKLAFRPDVPADARERAVAQALELVGSRAYGVDTGDLAEVVGARLVARGETLALAESCTAGKVAAWLGGVPGASRYLLEGAVVYSNAAKVRTCGVTAEALAAHGAVSEPVARQLAEGIRARAGATWGIGITGIAGPGGGTDDKPMGTVHIAVAGPEGTAHRCVRFPGDRQRVTDFSAAAALSQLHRLIRA